MQTMEKFNNLICNFDKDNSGLIDFQKFLDLMIILFSESDPEEKLNHAFELFDVNKNGFISFEDLKRVA